MCCYGPAVRLVINNEMNYWRCLAKGEGTKENTRTHGELGLKCVTVGFLNLHKILPLVRWTQQCDYMKDAEINMLNAHLQKSM